MNQTTNQTNQTILTYNESCQQFNDSPPSNLTYLNFRIYFFKKVPPHTVDLMVIIISVVLILNQIVSAIFINLIIRYDLYIKSYYRIISIMFGESVYELQFLQILGCINLLQTDFVPEISHIFNFLNKVNFISKIVYIP